MHICHVVRRSIAIFDDCFNNIENDYKNTFFVNVVQINHENLNFKTIHDFNAGTVAKLINHRKIIEKS